MTIEQLEKEIRNYSLNDPKGMKKYKDRLTYYKRCLKMNLDKGYDDLARLCKESIETQEKVLEHFNKTFAK